MGIYHPHSEGLKAEKKARRFLEDNGLIFIANNFRTKTGEIDLIMQDQECIVFVEVRSRRDLGFGNALESIQNNKIQRIINTAAFYLQTQNWLETKSSRFDVVAIDKSEEKTQIEWVKNAF